MLLLDTLGGHDRTTSILFMLVLLFVVWRITVAVVRAFKNSNPDPKTIQSNKKYSWRISRRSILRFFGLIHYPNIRYTSKESTSTFWAGIRNSFAGDTGISGITFFMVFISIVFVLVKWLWHGWRSAFPLKTLLVFLIVTLGLILGYVLLYCLTFVILKDFRFLLEAQLLHTALEDYWAKRTALQKAVKIYPSEFAFTKLGEVQKEITSSEERRDSRFYYERDYSKSHQYFDEAIQIDKNEKAPYLAKAKLYRYTKDYANALDSYREIQELEAESKPPKNRTIGDFSFARVYADWGKDLLIAGEYHESIDRLDHAIELYSGEDSCHLRWAYWDRSKAYLAMGELERAKDDLLATFRMTVQCYTTSLKRNYSQGEIQHFFKRNNWPKAFDDLIDYAFWVFKALEDQVSAELLLKEYLEDNSSLHFPVFLKRLILLLVSSGRTDEAKTYYDRHRAYLLDAEEIKKKFDPAKGYRDKSEFEDISIEQLNQIGNLLKVINSALDIGYFDMALKYLKRLEERAQASVHYRILYCSYMGRLLEQEWRFTDALKYYVELFQISDEQETDELVIA
ncbi:MAG: hypothetical protein AAFP77_18255 [Bacteroidota bacterium]